MFSFKLNMSYQRDTAGIVQLLHQFSPEKARQDMEGSELMHVDPPLILLILPCF